MHENWCEKFDWNRCHLPENGTFPVSVDLWRNWSEKCRSGYKCHVL